MEKKMATDELSTGNANALRDHLLSLLTGGNAHINLEDFVAGFPAEKCGQRIEGVPYTPWQVLEHIRIAQWDILEFCRDRNHSSPKWPEGYWPKPEEAGDPNLWQETVAKLRVDLKQMGDLISDPVTDLFAKIPHGTGQTILREALLVADHNSYHLGALVVMGRTLSNTKPD
jgi:hypothetical protein